MHVKIHQVMLILFLNIKGQTIVEKRTGGGNWIGVGILCLFPICWLGCQFIPLCIDDLKDAHHRCQHCRVVIGVKSGGF